jgi:hypothetical protein
VGGAGFCGGQLMFGMGLLLFGASLGLLILGGGGVRLTPYYNVSNTS